MNRLGILLLAAGESKRMGSPKQLLDFQGKKLIQHSIEQLLPLQPNAFAIVLGAHSHLIRPYLNAYPIECVENAGWEEGMGSSIAAGMRHLLLAELSHLLIALVDQPYLTRADYFELKESSQVNPTQIIAAYYGGKAGAPMIFPRHHFQDLIQLKGDEGARKIVRSTAEKLQLIELPLASKDWDRPSDITD
jgi:molybdenum cofactor cytidylyltransferase